MIYRLSIGKLKNQQKNIINFQTNIQIAQKRSLENIENRQNKGNGSSENKEKKLLPNENT